jgi:hypothetical protein
VVVMLMVMITTVTIPKGTFKITRLFINFIISVNAKWVMSHGIPNAGFRIGLVCDVNDD